jgi:hypothetical protein
MSSQNPNSDKTKASSQATTAAATTSIDRDHEVYLLCDFISLLLVGSCGGRCHGTLCVCVFVCWWRGPRSSPSLLVDQSFDPYRGRRRHHQASRYASHDSSSLTNPALLYYLATGTGTRLARQPSLFHCLYQYRGGRDRHPERYLVDVYPR